MENIESNNMWQMSVNELVNLLSEAYSNVYNTHYGDMKVFPSVMLWGPPGIGKSQGVIEIAKRLEETTGKNVYVTDVRLLLFNPIDLRGIPVADQNRELAIWLRPKIFQMKSEDCINILFLDEISAAPQSVQAAAYQITLDRKVGEHTLPDNCIVIAAGNRVSDKSVAVKMPKALANRLLHIEVEANANSWLTWAIKNNINPKVVSFLSENSHRLFSFDTDSDDLAFPTPRSWEMVSNVINAFNDDIEKAYPLIAGLIGRGLALVFISWCAVYKDLPKVEDIFNGVETRVPSKIDALYALVMSITYKAKEYKYDVIKIGNSLSYATRLPVDFAECLIQNYLLFDENYEEFLKQIPEYIEYARQKGETMNGQF